MHKITTPPHSILLIVYLLVALSWLPSVQADDDKQAVGLESISVVGTRRPVSVITDTPIPIDIISGDEFANQGSTDISNSLRTLVPSYNVNTQPISDAATFVRPANLRGLGPDQTLILLNGKRRHRAAVISFLGNGVSDGAQGADISVIPAIALKRVEVLRDSASAQYGSDAIAGVINFVLKDRPEGGIITTQWGQTYEGDGADYRTSGNIGLPLTERGFINISAEWREAEETRRSIQRADAQGLINAGNTDIEQPHAQIWGQPEVNDDWKTFVNAGFDVNDNAKLYTFGNYAEREVEGGFFFRNPNTRNGVYNTSGYKDDDSTGARYKGRVIQDVEGDGKFYKDEGEIGVKDDSDTMVVVQQNYRVLLGDSENCRDVENDGSVNYTPPAGCRSFNERFPGGFRPKFKGNLTDFAATGGFKGEIIDKLTYDLSYTYGENKVDFSIRDTINASYGLESPTAFELGSYIQTEQTVNFDLSYPFPTRLFASPLYVATGFEWRREQFEIVAGEVDSYSDGGFGQFEASIGANGFSGFSDRVAGQWERSNKSVYLDLDTDVVKDITVKIMGRFEDHEEFDANTDFKVASLYQVTHYLGVRGSVSTGFRVPTVGQQNVQNLGTEFQGTALIDRGRIPATCPEAQVFGAKPLESEQAFTISAGAVADVGPVALTVDYFNIKINDRIGASGDKKISDKKEITASQVINPCLQNLKDDTEFTYLGNGFNTRTQGIDVTASVDTDLSPILPFLADGTSTLTFVGNWTNTRVTSFDANFLDNKRIILLEQALPDYRFNITFRHEQGAWSGLSRINYYGDYTELHLNTESRKFTPGSEVTWDVELSYAFLEALKLTAGIENILNNFPDRNPYATDAGSKYPESSPMGSNGGFYYFRASYLF